MYVCARARGVVAWEAEEVTRGVSGVGQDESRPHGCVAWRGSV